MTKIAKLNARFLMKGTIDYLELLALLDAYGFRRIRQSGSHATYGRVDILEKVNVQPRGKDAKDYQVDQFRRIVEDHKLRLGQS